MRAITKQPAPVLTPTAIVWLLLRGGEDELPTVEEEDAAVVENEGGVVMGVEDATTVW